MHQTPARVVVHKTSRFWPDERDGFRAAIESRVQPLRPAGPGSPERRPADHRPRSTRRCGEPGSPSATSTTCTPPGTSPHSASSTACTSRPRSKSPTTSARTPRARPPQGGTGAHEAQLELGRTRRPAAGHDQVLAPRRPDHARDPQRPGTAAAVQVLHLTAPSRPSIAYSGVPRLMLLAGTQRAQGFFGRRPDARTRTCAKRTKAAGHQCCRPTGSRSATVCRASDFPSRRTARLAMSADRADSGFRGLFSRAPGNRLE